MPAHVDPIGLDELEALSRYAAGECGPEESLRIEASLKSREGLRRALARLRKLEALTGEMTSSALSQEPQAANSLDERLIARTISASAPPHRASRWVAGAQAIYGEAGSIALASGTALIGGARTVEAFAESGGMLGICLHKGAWTHEEGSDQMIQMNPPQALSFHAAIQVAAKNGRARRWSTRSSPTSRPRSRSTCTAAC